jgi:hypothetical protein
MKAVAFGLILAGAILGGILASGQRPFAQSRFEFGVVRPHEGVLEIAPIPILWTPNGALLLVASGKHGAVFPRDADGYHVSLEGSLIQRGRWRMLEVREGSLEVGRQAARTRWLDAGEVAITGEVVDTKCFLGVMNPGEGKVHRACAARCIRGGVPAAIATTDRLVLLTGADLSDFAGERVTVRGRLQRVEQVERLQVDTLPSRRE